MTVFRSQGTLPEVDTPETRFAKGPEGYVGYQVFGGGELDVLFFPPWVWNVDAMWEEPRIERFFRRLASFSRVMVLNIRGTGVSNPVPLGAFPTLEEWSDDLRVVLNDVGSESAAAIGASESAGASGAVLFAALHPERVQALVVVNGSVAGTRRDDYPAGFPARLVDQAVQTLGEPGSVRDVWVPLLVPSLAGDERFCRWMERFVRLSIHPSLIGLMLRTGFEMDIRSALPTIQVPTLIIHRAGNRYMRVGHGRYLAEHITGAKYVELPGEDHFFFAGDTDELLDEIEAFLTGRKGLPEIDRILSTVLFTDIVDSTKRAAEMGDRRWREMLDAHESLSQREVERFRGRLIKTTGDGMLATFDGPARAIRCARSLADEARALGGMEVRAGLHTGEVELRGEDVGGIAVHIAARVMAEARPGEVMVSGAVPPLVAGSGIEFEDRGERALKGVPGEWRLFAVRSQSERESN